MAQGKLRFTKAELSAALTGLMGFAPTDFELDNTFRTLTGEFWENRQAAPVFLRHDEEGSREGNPAFVVEPRWQASLTTEPNFRAALADLGAYILERARQETRVRLAPGTFVYGRGYTYEESQRIAGWPNELNGGAVGGAISTIGPRKPF